MYISLSNLKNLFIMFQKCKRVCQKCVVSDQIKENLKNLFDVLERHK